MVNFSFYPNPANEKLTVDLILQNAGRVQLNLYSMLGGLVLNTSVESFKEGIIPIDVSAFPDGIYSLELITPQAILQRKVVKKQ